MVTKTLKNEHCSSSIYKSNYYKTFFFRLIRKKAFIVSLFILLSLFTIGLTINLFINKEKLFLIDFESSFLPPSSKYWFGTNEFGQDFFFHVFVGIFNTIKIAFYASLLNLIVGIFLGCVWGHYSRIDNLMLFISNVINNMPLPFFYIIVISSIGTGFFPMLFVITILGWINIAILVRNNLITTRNTDYNLYSKLCHTSPFKIAINNHLPSLLPIIFNAFAISLPEIISLEVTLSYFGFSFGNNSISLGLILHSILSSGNWLNHFHLFIIPLVFIYIINLCFFYIGKSISEASIKEDDICLK